MTLKVLLAKNLEDLPGLASAILNELPEERIFAFAGKMGVGKTTFIKEFCKVLEVPEIVSSPTFSLVNEYTSSKFDSIYHFDFYRIKKVEEVYDIGYEEYFFNNNYCLIEWPEMVIDLLPDRYVKINMDISDDGDRIIYYQIITN